MTVSLVAPRPKDRVPLLLAPNDNSKSRSSPSRPIPRLETVSLRLGLCKTTPEGGLDPGGASGARVSDGFGKRDRTIEKSKYGGCMYSVCIL